VVFIFLLGGKVLCVVGTVLLVVGFVLLVDCGRLVVFCWAFLSFEFDVCPIAFFFIITKVSIAKASKN